MTRIDLRGTWRLEGAGEQVAAEIPGDSHSALLAAGKIEDPYWGTNELDLQYLNGQDWVFSRSFEVSAQVLSAPSVYLHFDSIDTVATVFVNGQVVGRSDNMFARCRFSVKKWLREGTNRVEVRVRSAENVAGGGRSHFARVRLRWRRGEDHRPFLPGAGCWSLAAGPFCSR